MSTHGSICFNLKKEVQITWVLLDDIQTLSECYLYIEYGRKNSQLYKTNFSKFKEYLLTREDGLYPPMYAFNMSMTLCICYNSEDSLSRPIKVYRYKI